jgi:hypothetical protein
VCVFMPAHFLLAPLAVTAWGFLASSTSGRSFSARARYSLARARICSCILGIFSSISDRVTDPDQEPTRPRARQHRRTDACSQGLAGVRTK